MVTADTIADFELLRTSGPVFRGSREGPERDLLHQYLEENIPPARKERNVQIFIEPRVDSAFPDAVIVYWNPSVTVSWPEHRSSLSPRDIRVLHFLSTRRGGTIQELRKVHHRGLGACVDRLLSADVVYQKGDRWFARALRKIFAVDQIIAIEAKVNSWRRGLEQALHNTWFASDSYLLVPSVPGNKEMQELAAQYGVGVVGKRDPIAFRSLRRSRDSLPKSYASWLFNEWVWRAAGHRT